MPAASEETEMDAVPLARVARPRVVEVEVSEKTTVPVGAPDVEATAAVKVTGCPKIDGSGVEIREVVVEVWDDPVLFSSTLTAPGLVPFEP